MANPLGSNPESAFDRPEPKPAAPAATPGKSGGFTPRADAKPRNGFMETLFGSGRPAIREQTQERIKNNRFETARNKIESEKIKKGGTLFYEGSRNSVNRMAGMKTMGQMIYENKRLMKNMGLQNKEDVKKFTANAVGKNPFWRVDNAKKTLGALGGKSGAKGTDFLSKKQQYGIKYNRETKQDFRDMYQKITGQKFKP